MSLRIRAVSDPNNTISKLSHMPSDRGRQGAHGAFNGRQGVGNSRGNRQSSGRRLQSPADTNEQFTSKRLQHPLQRA